MDTDKDNDFTFCQVAKPDQNGSDDQKVIPDIRNIRIEDEGSISNSRGETNFWSNKLLPSNTTTVKEDKVGSLSFNVISTTQTQPSQSPGETNPDGVGSSQKNQAVQKPMAKKPAARAKVPFEKGYSQMDWIKLTRTHPDLAGLNGQSNKRLIPTSEVKQNQTEGSMWTVLKGRVYNIYPYMKFHPGGVDMLMKAVGKDCTSLFNKYHAWVNAEFLLEKCLVGILDDNHATDQGK